MTFKCHIIKAHQILEEGGKEMLITICDVPESLRADVERAGGEIVRSWNELNDVQFKNHKMRVSAEYVHVWQPTTHHGVILYESEFSRIYIQ